MSVEIELDYRLRFMDFDRYGRMQPAALLDILQDVATIHAEQLNIGRDAVIARGLFWAIVRIKLEIVRQPERYTVVTVRSWPHSLSRLSFWRDFSIRDESGAELIRASTEWVLMDVENRTFASARDLYAGPTDFCEDRAFEKKPRKVADFDASADPLLVLEPRYSDIDLNGHVNNAMYANFIVNALDPCPDGALKTLQIDYRHEALAGTELSVYSEASEGEVRVKGVNPDGQISFAALMELA